LSIVAVCHQARSQSAPQSALLRTSEPKLLSYDELVSLSEKDPVDEPLNQKLTALLHIPFISNEAYYDKTQPHVPGIPRLGQSLRVVLWNIERGLELDDIKLALANKAAFLSKVQAQHSSIPDQDENTPLCRQARLTKLEDELNTLGTADVIVLNEVDWGVKRTAYQNVVRELGDALHMNWAYGVEFVEVDPMILGTEKFSEIENEADRAKMLSAIQVDKSKLRALHGTAVLSRYAIREAKLAPFEHQGYDWYHGEQNISAVEKGKRAVAIVVGEKLGREIRRGGRTNLIVTLDVPKLREGRLTVAATHLENRTDPKDRRLQMEELLTLLKATRNPVVVAGDLNTTLSKGRPRSLSDTVASKMGETEFWVRQGVKYGTGVGLIYGVMTFSYKQVQFQNDPTVSGVKLVASNPEAALFKSIENFRFDDGTTFDFRGAPQYTINDTSGTLADSNQRASKGFATTFQFERTIGAKGRFKLDWIFVKAYNEDPRDEKGPRLFAPTFPRTMFETNYAFPKRLSDHTPISVDLPFGDPAAQPAK
jgi:endonuclease/exonuclease/phosphatase family metal-dependent hydrolase